MRAAILAAEHLDLLIQALRDSGYLVIGPVRDELAIVYDEIRSVRDLSQGWLDEQEKGHYRLLPSGDGRYFGHTVAANAWKKFLNPPKRLLWRARQHNGQLQFMPQSEDAPQLAFLGVRSCELHAIEIQDAVFVHDQHRDEVYSQRRQSLFTVAVNCTRAAATCFCASMNTGPEVTLPSDLVLTEVLDDASHYFLVDGGSERGRNILATLPLRAATSKQQALAKKGIESARQQMQTGPRFFDSAGIKELLYRNLESPAWDEVADRCLSCANCTLACPTCFCSAVEDTTDLTGEHAERWQQWDSCFNGEFSYIHGGSVRQTTRSRYRQWMTHKLASWIDQFGHSGCVGCGRCISWCPVGIDITEQLQAIQQADKP
ncbi:sulfite reductase subunit A [Aestuariicella hydrocarbonica]|uniref:Sulfite reductase subunit A n=1 Tax=Pseudomaricurvus hydrocarbonicus TaxID=1470433 RepID=A0A9E5MN62_9GAMM|nr:4Fe-4S dicluster domain-containing protein [Aestuariicella hydrocarbonica]NHO67297.1 sulfite reductase subunit A [Aestuariicella hydrocarbonica]